MAPTLTPEEQAAADKKAADDKAAADAKAAADKKAADDKAAADAKAAADKKAADDAAKAGAKKAPEKYELKLPEGSSVHADVVLALEKRARAADLTNDEAQNLLNDYDAQLGEQRAAYRATTEADKDYGGANLERSQKRANLVIDRIRPVGHPRRDAFLRILRAGGADNHVEVLAFLADLGAGLEEDKPDTGLLGANPRGPEGEKKTAAEHLYGKK